LTRESDRLRDGFYYFAAESTPCFPGLHLLGSAIWTSDERIIEPKLGEWNGERSFMDGRPPVRRPLPVLVGSLDCIANGEKEGLAVINDVGADCGPVSPNACYGPVDLLRAKTDVNDCVFAHASANIINDAYIDLAGAADAVSAYLGEDAVVTTFEQPSPLIPAGLIAIIGDTAVLWLTGTTTPEQLATQALYDVAGLTNQGNWSCSAFYQVAAFVWLDLLTGVLPVDPTRIVLIGHSYGGAICDVMAAILRSADDTREVELLTLGAPQPGDKRLFDVIAPIPQRHYANQRDPIPYLPPRGTTLAGLIPIIGPALGAFWPRFSPPPNTMMVFRDGQFAEVNEEFIAHDLIETVASVIANALDMPRFKDHSPEWYAYYLCLGCKCVSKPCPEPAVDELAFEMLLEDFEYVFDEIPVTVSFGPLTLVAHAHFLNGQPSAWSAFVEGVGLFSILAAAQEFDLYTTFVAKYQPDPVDPVWGCEWDFSADEMLSSIQTTDLPDTFNEKEPGDGAVSLGLLKILPILV